MNDSKSAFDSIILNTAFRYIAPFVLVYGVYVLFHGEYSPGGGFQAGGLFGIAVVLDRFIKMQSPALNMPDKLAVILAGIGTFIFLITGVITMIFGGKYLEYVYLPIAVSEAERHVLGITYIEVGVAVCVMATIIVIFDALTRSKE